MSNKSLSAFMAQNVAKVENHKFVLSSRFVDVEKPILDNKGEPTGKYEPTQWEISCISASENQKLRRDCMISAPLPGGKKGQRTQEFDSAAYQAKLAARCVVFPDLNNAEVQDSWGVSGAEQLITTMLTGGEFDNLIAEIFEHNGFTDMDEMVDEAKN